MFTGIVEKVGTVDAVDRLATASNVAIATGFKDLSIGESVAVNGVCLTVAESVDSMAVFFISHESLARTNLGALLAGSKVNLERALKFSDRMSGHIVQGHVDSVAVVSGISKQVDAVDITITIPAQLSRYCVVKGSLAVNGVSLTINTISDSLVELGFTLIPHTWANTNLSTLTVGDTVNIEVDVIAKHLEKLCQTYIKH
ncbi:MAG: riboflavin synthase [Bdellovibrionota bacterium]